MSASILARTLVVGAVFIGWIPAAARMANAEPVCNYPDTKPHLVSQALPVFGRPPKPGPSSSPRTGMVTVDVALDVNSRVTGTTVSSSTNPALDAAVVAAARGSTFRTQVTDCHPIASTFFFVITVANASAVSDIRTGAAPSQPPPEVAASPQPSPSAATSAPSTAVSAASTPGPSASTAPNAPTPHPSAGG